MKTHVKDQVKKSLAEIIQAYLGVDVCNTSRKREVVYTSGTVVPASVMAWTMTTATTRKYQDYHEPLLFYMGNIFKYYKIS